jgi:hypothetical protein
VRSVQVLAINVTGERSISLDDMELASDVRLLASRVGTTGGDWHVDDRFQLVDNEHPLIVSSEQ